METPTSDFESLGGLSPDDPITPTAPFSPAQQCFQVTIGEPTKTGGTLTFTVATTKCADGLLYKVKRTYEDFEWLHQTLFDTTEVAGIVVPPLPPKPGIVASQITPHSQKTNTGNAPNLIGVHPSSTSRSLEQYLQLIVSHQILGRYHTLEAFLLRDEVCNRPRPRKGWLGKLSSVVDETRKSGHKDIDDYFQNQREKINKYNTEIVNMNQAFQKVLASEERMASAYGHLATTLNMGGSFQLRNKYNLQSNKLLVKFSEALEDIKQSTEVDHNNDDNTLGFHLNHSCQYAHALKEMLYRRTCLMIAYEDANRNLAKAKPNKQDLAEEEKVQAEKAFEHCSELGRREIVNFHQQKVKAFQEALVSYAEAKIKTAQDTYTLIMKSLVEFKQQ